MPVARPLWTVAFVAALAAGAALRLVWIEDMEYKADEIYMFEISQQYRATHVLPRAGNKASVGLPNPGVSTWLFIIPARLFSWSSPLDLARLMQVSAIAALGLLTWFALRYVDRTEREPWLWAAALASVNPLAVLIERKIWSPSILPVFLVVALAGWWRRRSTSGAFLWGFTHALVAQIHLAGVFLLAGFAGWAAIFERCEVRWRGWILGIAAAAALSIPWAIETLSEGSPAVTIVPPLGSRGPLSRALLAALCVAQLTLSAAFLQFIHDRGGAPGDYGVSYRMQSPSH